MELSEASRAILKAGSVKIRVMRNGMLQQLTFRVRSVKHGNIVFIELHTDRLVDMSELLKVSEETGLPVEAQNGRAFPKGKSAIDFIESGAPA